MGNKGGDVSLLELSNENTIRERMETLERAYDMIIIETPALEDLNKAGEWALFSDKVMAVFEAGQILTERKKANIAYLAALGNQFLGWAMNKVNHSEENQRRAK